ncbi:integrase [Paramagnetospirillum caucaseum]|uniref:Integrase n=2 Tax=Paramagnetospirillum caucaseum TaxID=1244869 RepID=M2YB80_9PROT|nr:integrase [Paramagnetospirillum caucaseum]
MYLAIEMIIFTAARKMEVLSMQWDAIKDGYIHVTDKGNSRRRKPKIKQIVITDPVQELLGRIPKNSKWLFARSTAPELHITSVDEVWCDVRKEAGLPHVNIHDLRRSWITFAIDDLKISLETVSKAVGHSSPEVTRIHYNKIARKTKLKANHDIAEGLASAMMGD